MVEKSKELGFNLSKTFENQLKHLITQFSTRNSVNNFESAENKMNVMGLPVPTPKRVQNLLKIEDCFKLQTGITWWRIEQILPINCVSCNLRVGRLGIEPKRRQVP